MLGLTDKEISRHPNYIPGIPSSWKERKYNAAYVLSQDPDIIIFSTDYKPSAPAERALFLYSKFRQNYYSFLLLTPGSPSSVFRRKGSYEKRNQIFSDSRFVNLFNEAINLENEKDYIAAIDMLKQMLEICPDDFAWGYQELGMAHCFSGYDSEGRKYLIRAIEMDPYCISAHGILGDLYSEEGRYEEALEEYEAVNLYNVGLAEKRISRIKMLINEKKGQVEEDG